MPNLSQLEISISTTIVYRDAQACRKATERQNEKTTLDVKSRARQNERTKNDTSRKTARATKRNNDIFKFGNFVTARAKE